MRPYETLGSFAPKNQHGTRIRAEKKPSHRRWELPSSLWGWRWGQPNTKNSYPPENQHENGKSPLLTGDTSSNGCFSIVMLIFWGVYDFEWSDFLYLSDPEWSTYYWLREPMICKAIDEGKPMVNSGGYEKRGGRLTSHCFGEGFWANNGPKFRHILGEKCGQKGHWM